MTENPAVEALAAVWASIDGRLEKFEDERRIVNSKFATTSIVKDGHYAGYMAEAEEAIDRLEKRGFRIIPKPPELTNPEFRYADVCEEVYKECPAAQAIEPKNLRIMICGYIKGVMSRVRA